MPTKQASRLILDETAHKYYYDGRNIPGNTEILKAAGLYDYIDKAPSFVMEFGRERGSAVHRACELYIKGTLDDSSIHPEVDPYFEQFKKFVAETGLLMEYSEEIFYFNNGCGVEFGTTVDIVGKLKNISEDDRFIIEIKTTNAQRESSKLQTVAQMKAVMQTEHTDVFGASVLRRAALVLTPTSHELDQHESEYDGLDWSDFVFCNRVYHLKKRRGLL